MADRTGTKHDWAAAAAAAEAAMSRPGYYDDERGALETAAKIFHDLEEKATDAASEAYGYILGHMKHGIPEGARVIWSSESPMGDPAYDEGLEKHPDADKNTLDAMLSEQPSQWRDDERANLESGCTGTLDVVIISDNGRWNGRHTNVITGTGVTLGDALLKLPVQDHHDEFIVYARDGQVRADGIHHDATDHYLILEAVNIQAVQENMGAVIAGLPEAAGWTRSIYPRVAAVYGWPIDDIKENQEGGSTDAESR